MQKQKSLLEFLFVVAFYLAGFFVGYKHGEHLTRIEISERVKSITKDYESHLDSLIRDLEFVRTASDSAKQVAINREIEWFKQYLLNRVAD